jgi:hypothetical protein
MQLEGLGKLNNSVTPSGIEPATFRLRSVVPQPSTLLRAASVLREEMKLGVNINVYTKTGMSEAEVVLRI